MTPITVALLLVFAVVLSFGNLRSDLAHYKSSCSDKGRR